MQTMVTFKISLVLPMTGLILLLQNCAPAEVTQAPITDPQVPAGEVAMHDYVTEIIGQSQTNHWFNYVNLKQVAMNKWQGRIDEGSGYMHWKDENFDIWAATVNDEGDYYKGCGEGTPMPNPQKGIVIGSDCVPRAYADIERVVITVGKSPQETGFDGTYASILRETIQTVRKKYPNLKEIRLQALASGKDGSGNPTICQVDNPKTPAIESDHVNTTVNFAAIQVAITELTGTLSDVKAGPMLLIPCEQFGDKTGHMKDDGNLNVANQMAEFYKPR